MRKPSSSTAAVTFLDRDAVVASLTAAAADLVRQDRNVGAVVLFGSLASGTPTPSSDADLLIVLRHDDRRMIDRIPDYSKAFESAGVGIQVLPWTERELAVRRLQQDRFAREILETGRVLAGALPA